MSIVLNADRRWTSFGAKEDARPLHEASDYREFVFRCALAVCGHPDPAEDVTQEVLLILVNKIQLLATLQEPCAWIRRVTVRSATKAMNREKSARQLDERIHSETFSPEQFAVYEVLRQLNPDDRALLGMALSQGVSYAEIAEALDIPEGTVGSRLHKAKLEFRKRWSR